MVAPDTIANHSACSFIKQIERDGIGILIEGERRLEACFRVFRGIGRA
jgi:hypothetical protein